MQGVLPWPLVTGDAVRSGAGGHVGGEDVVGVAVEVLAGPVVPHRGARIGVAGSDLDTSRKSTPASSMVVTKVWRSMCGCGLAIRTPAVSASRRRRRVAAWRSIRPPRLLSRIGPRMRVPIARSIARPRNRKRWASSVAQAHSTHSRIGVTRLLNERKG
jgi:hypothetical protein